MKGSENERREGRGIGEQFREETRYTAERIGYALDWQRMPDPYKNYASPLATIALPAPLTGQAASVWDGTERRKDFELRAIVDGILNSVRSGGGENLKEMIRIVTEPLRK